MCSKPYFILGEQYMKRSIVVVAIAMTVSGLFGCSGGNNTPTPTDLPSQQVSPSVTTTEPTEAPSTRPPVKPSTRQATKPTSAAPSQTTTDEDAAPPATKFAERWGKKYPGIQEYAILKGANKVCGVIDAYPAWMTDTKAVNLIVAAANSVGIKDDDAVEFAQDASQNYCPTV
jgi:hypothetical protein